MDVALISPVNNFCIKEFSYNPDEINQFSMSRLIGLGLSLIKNIESEDKSFSRSFIVQDFNFDKYIKEGSKNIEDKKVSEKTNSLNKSSQINSKLTSKPKAKSEEKKKELPPLPNLKNIDTKTYNKNSKDVVKEQTDKPESKKNKSFKIDSSFLKND